MGILGNEVGVDDAAEVWAGQEATSRDGGDAALPFELGEGDDDVDGGEAGAEEDDVAALGGQLFGPVAPRIGPEAWVIGERRVAGERARWLIASCEQHDIRGDGLARFERNRGFVAFDGDIEPASSSMT